MGSGVCSLPATTRLGESEAIRVANCRSVCRLRERLVGGCPPTFPDLATTRRLVGLVVHGYLVQNTSFLDGHHFLMHHVSYYGDPKSFEEQRQDSQDLL